jgi:hypothetical protein
MNLQESITLAELKAGGPGSGCRGPNCGRPEGKMTPIQKQIWEKQAAPDPIHIDYPKITPKNAPAKSLSAPQKLYKDYAKKQALGPENMQKQFGHVAKTTDGTIIKEGDIVKLLKPDTLWNMKTGDVDRFPAGKLKGVVVNVLQKVGDNQAVKLNIMPPTKNHEADQFRYLPAQDLQLHKAAGPTTIETAPVKNSQILQQFKSVDGATVTYVKTPQTKDYTPRTIEQLASLPSRYKGQFQQIDKVIGAADNITRIYDSSKVPSTKWGVEGPATAASRPGATVFVDRYPNKIVVEERPYQKWGFRSRGPIQWTYDHPQKYLLQALGTLKKRYGISIPSKEDF